MQELEIEKRFLVPTEKIDTLKFYDKNEGHLCSKRSST